MWAWLNDFDAYAHTRSAIAASITAYEKEMSDLHTSVDAIEKHAKAAA